MKMILEENPRRYNPVAVDQFGRPVVISASSPRKRRRNPMAMIPSVTKLTGGIGAKEIIGGAAGLAGSSMIPNAMIKTAAVTTTDKAIKIGLSVLSTLAVGYIFGKWDQRAGRAAIVGGLSGVAITVVNTLRPGTISGGAGGQRQLMAPVQRRLGESMTVGPAFTREGENVTLIRP